MQKVPQNGRTPQPVSAYDWDTDTYTYDVSQMDAQQVWRTAVALAATKARQALPECSSRIDRAIELVLNDAVELHADGSATITSQHNGTKTYTVCSGTCACADSPKAPGSWCKHKLAKALVIRAVQLAKELGSRTGLVMLAPAHVQAPQEPAQAAPLSLHLWYLTALRQPQSPQSR